MPDIDAMTEKLMKDPDFQAKIGKTKRETAQEEATQRAHQHRKNSMALALGNESKTAVEHLSEYAKLEAQRKEIDEMVFGVPTEEIRDKMARPLNVVDIDINDLTLSPPPANTSTQVKEELETIIDKHLQTKEDTDNFEFEIAKPAEIQDLDILKSFIKLAEELGLSDDITKKKLEVIKDDSATIVLNLKYYFNRPRPEQLMDYHGVDFKPADFKTSDTPAYPSGHAFQGTLIALILSEVFPQHADSFMKLGESIGENRVIFGVHYPSDHAAGIELAKQVFPYVNFEKLDFKPIPQESQPLEKDLPNIEKATGIEIAATGAALASGGIALWDLYQAFKKNKKLKQEDKVELNEALEENEDSLKETKIDIKEDELPDLENADNVDELISGVKNPDKAEPIIEKVRKKRWDSGLSKEDAAKIRAEREAKRKDAATPLPKIGEGVEEPKGEEPKKVDAEKKESEQVEEKKEPRKIPLDIHSKKTLIDNIGKLVNHIPTHRGKNDSDTSRGKFNASQINPDTSSLDPVVHQSFENWSTRNPEDLHDHLNSLSEEKLRAIASALGEQANQVAPGSELNPVGSSTRLGILGRMLRDDKSGKKEIEGVSNKDYQTALRDSLSRAVNSNHDITVPGGEEEIVEAANENLEEETRPSPEEEARRKYEAEQKAKRDAEEADKKEEESKDKKTGGPSPFAVEEESKPINLDEADLGKIKLGDSKELTNLNGYLSDAKYGGIKGQEFTNEDGTVKSRYMHGLQEYIKKNPTSAKIGTDGSVEFDPEYIGNLTKHFSENHDDAAMSRLWEKNYRHKGASDTSSIGYGDYSPSKEARGAILSRKEKMDKVMEQQFGEDWEDSNDFDVRAEREHLQSMDSKTFNKHFDTAYLKPLRSQRQKDRTAGIKAETPKDPNKERWNLKDSSPDEAYEKAKEMIAHSLEHSEEHGGKGLDEKTVSHMNKQLSAARKAMGADNIKKLNQEIKDGSIQPTKAEEPKEDKDYEGSDIPDEARGYGDAPEGVKTYKGPSGGVFYDKREAKKKDSEGGGDGTSDSGDTGDSGEKMPPPSIPEDSKISSDEPVGDKASAWGDKIGSAVSALGRLTGKAGKEDRKKLIADAAKTFKEAGKAVGKEGKRAFNEIGSAMAEEIARSRGYGEAQAKNAKLKYQLQAAARGIPIAGKVIPKTEGYKEESKAGVRGAKQDTRAKEQAAYEKLTYGDKVDFEVSKSNLKKLQDFTKNRV